LHAEEGILGNQFEVTVRVGIPEPTSFTLADSINYAELLAIVEDSFKDRTLLLEELIRRIRDRIEQRFKEVLIYLYIQIDKLHPPLPLVVSSSSVILEKRYTL
jgi:dihydroneopterin aldolase